MKNWFDCNHLINGCWCTCVYSSHSYCPYFKMSIFDQMKWSDMCELWCVMTTLDLLTRSPAQLPAILWYSGMSTIQEITPAASTAHDHLWGQFKGWKWMMGNGWLTCYYVIQLGLSVHLIISHQVYFCHRIFSSSKERVVTFCRGIMLLENLLLMLINVEN